MPDHARGAHGNLAEQSRSIGPNRGAETAFKDVKTAQNSQNILSNTAVAQSILAQAAPEKIAVASLESIKPILDKNACLACHGMSNKLVGPLFKDIAARFKTTGGAVNLLSGKIKDGRQGAWGATAMPAQALSAAESAQIAQWLMGGMLP